MLRIVPDAESAAKLFDETIKVHTTLALTHSVVQ